MITEVPICVVAADSSFLIYEGFVSLVRFFSQMRRHALHALRALRLYTLYALVA